LLVQLQRSISFGGCVFLWRHPDHPLPFLSGFFFHDRDISVGLICYHLPTSHKARQNRSFSSALCQEHEAMTFLGVSRHRLASCISRRDSK
jgi:hypothetical protein